MANRFFEYIAGGVIIAIFLGFAVFLYRTSLRSDTNSYYKLYASFRDTTGVVVGTDVLLSGVKVGKVESIALNDSTYEAILALKIKTSVVLPIDTRASIMTSGLVGNRVVVLDPGVEPDFLKNGDRIVYSTSSLNLETLVGKFLQLMSPKKGSAE